MADLDEKYAWAMPSESAKSQLGKVITWDREASGRRKAMHVEGICIGVEIVGGARIVNSVTDESWPAVRFLIRPLDGSRNVWTTEFPDKPEAVTGG